ncbi:MAG: FHA domain-containing protein [Myxococcales bacterium]|nr:FHA domain-containing protein [Myxococcales bacterium]
MIRLVIAHSSGKKTTFTTEALVTSVGSNPFCEALIEDPSVAARQCTLTRHLDGRVFLEARAPGLRMDGQSVAEGQAVLLHQGSTLSFGASEAVVEFEAVSRKGSSTYVIQLAVGEFGGIATLSPRTAQ